MLLDEGLHGPSWWTYPGESDIMVNELMPLQVGNLVLSASPDVDRTHSELGLLV